MNKPSIKSLESAFPGKGKLLRQLLESLKACRNMPETGKWIDSCHHMPSNTEIRLSALNEALEGHGVEYASKANNPMDTYDWAPSLEYINMGDTYTPTIVRFANGRYVVSDIGSILERGNYV